MTAREWLSLVQSSDDDYYDRPTVYEFQGTASRVQRSAEYAWTTETAS